MLGEYLTALLVAVFGYVYPVYLTFKVRVAPRPSFRAAASVRHARIRLGLQPEPAMEILLK